MYILKCIKCGNLLEDEDVDFCIECDNKEVKQIDFAKKERSFKRVDNKKLTHRTKKRHTKPRKEVEKNDE